MYYIFLLIGFFLITLPIFGTTSLIMSYEDVLSKNEDTKEKIMSILPFHTKFMRFIASDYLNPDQKTKADLFYFIRASVIWTEYAIVCSHRFCELKKFEHLHVLFNKSDFTGHSTVTPLSQQIDNFKIIHSAFIETILMTPQKLVDDVANEMTENNETTLLVG